MNEMEKFLKENLMFNLTTEEGEPFNKLTIRLNFLGKPLLPDFFYIKLNLPKSYKLEAI